MWSFFSQTPVGILALFSVPFLFTSETLAVSIPRLVPRSQLINIPIHSLHGRGIVENGTVVAGLSSIALANDRQSYFTVITAGNIHFRVALDTASSDLWIVSSNCETSQCKKVPRYPLSYGSPTFVAVNDNATTFNASYADGTVASGFVAKETVELANLTLASQSFGVITDSNVSLADETSGIMGLGFPRISTITNLTTNSTPFFPALAQQGLLEYPLFALSLTRNYTGSLSIGAIDASVVANASLIGWNRVASFPPFVSENNVSVATYLQWAIPISGFSVNDTNLQALPTYPTLGGKSLALFDVGAPGIYGPIQDVSRIFSLIDGARIIDSSGQWAIPCDATDPLAFTFGSHRYSLLPEDYIIGPASGNPNLCLSWPRALPPSSDGIDWQIGAAFLRTVYSIYSFGINSKEPPMIGLYPLRNVTTNTNATQASEFLSSFLSSVSATIATTLPNFVLPTPTFTTPPYALNSSIPASVGAVVSVGLATSTYSPIFGTGTAFNASALPTISPEPSVSTIKFTDQAGQIGITLSTYTTDAVTLGIPPGWSAGLSIHVSLLKGIFLCKVLVWTLGFAMDFVL